MDSRNDLNLLDSKQLEIYKGLRSIGPEISAFYLDGVRIVHNDNLETKSYLLAHVAREIEGGLRSVLSHVEEKIEKCSGPTTSTHLESIAVALGMNSNDPLVMKWFKLAGRFYKYAHRHGAMKEPRGKTEFESLWKEFEDILFVLVGSYYNLLDRVDRILKYEIPTKEILDTLPNLFKLEARESYFFRNLSWLKWLKPLKERDYFDPQKNPSPEEVPGQPGYYRIPVWNALIYLENAAKKNGEKPQDAITNLIVEIINSIVDFRNDKGERIENYRSDWFLIKIICNLPRQNIESKHIEFIRTALRTKWERTSVSVEIADGLFPKLLRDQAKDLVIKLLDVILEYEPIKGEALERFMPLMEEYWLDDCLKKHKTEVAKLCAIEAAQVGLSKIKTIIKDNKHRFNNAIIPSIEDSSQTHFPEEYEYQVIRFVRDMYESADSGRIRENVSSLTKEEHPIFRRIAIHLINHHYKNLNDIFWSWNGNPLNEYQLKHELYELLKANCTSFNEKQIEQILDWVESKEYYVSKEITNAEDRERILAYKKKEWISSLLATENEKVNLAYKKYQDMNPDVIDHPGFDSWIEVTTGLGEMGTEAFLGKTNVEIAQYLNTLEKEGPRRFYDIESTRAFAAYVSANSEQFSKGLDPFKSVHLMYQYSLVRGLREAWAAGKNFPLENVFSLISCIVESEEFWEKQATGEESYRDWITVEMARFIEEGTKDDKHAFEAKFLPQAEGILLILAKKTKSGLAETDDLIMAALNSPKGCAFLAMINYSLHVARLSEKDQAPRWATSIKSDFDMRLNRRIEPALEFSTILGQYLAHLYYLDEKWVIENINRIFPNESDAHWKAALTGHLFYSRRVHKELYFLLREHGHYAKAIETTFADRRVTEGLVGHICIGYIEEWESLSDKTSLIYKLIEHGSIDQLSEVIHLFWKFREKLSDKIRPKVKPLWSALIGRLSQNKENPEYQRALSNLSTWLSLIDRIDDQILEYLKASAPYIQKTDEYFLTEYLLKHVSDAPARVSEIYIAMLNAGVYPDIKEENIKEIVEILYDRGQRETADRICNRYGEKGFDFLRAIFEKHKEQNQTTAKTTETI